MTHALPLVLLPGLHGTAGLLEPLAVRLGTHRPVHPIDYPRDAGLDLAGYIAHVLERLPAERFAILGESFSGPIAIAAAAQRPDTAALILASTFARFPVPRVLAPAIVALFRARVRPRRAALVLGGRGATPALIDALTETIAALPRDLVAQRIRVALGADARRTLAQTACPLLCLTGSRDRLTGRGALASILAARPDAEVERFDAGHLLLETHVDTAAEQIERFLRRVAGRCEREQPQA